MSFNIALSGIQAINQQLEAVSNNIANAGTYGYKSSRANFATVFAGEQATGVEIGSLTQSINLNGSLTTTGRGLDAAIQGRGFFTVRDNQGGLQYSRVGIFSADKDGFLVDASSRKVQGYDAGPTGALGTMGDIRVPTGQIPAQASTGVTYVGNLSADWKVPLTATFDPTDANSYNMVKQSVLFDSLGNQHTVSQYFIKQAAPVNTVAVRYAFDGDAPIADTTTLTFDVNGQLPPVNKSAPLTMTVAGAAPLTFTVDYSGTTQFAGEANTTTNGSDGYASGVFVGVELAEDGSVLAKYSNEQQQVIGTLAIATFADEGSLTQSGDTSWVASVASGAPLYSTPGVGLAGKLSRGMLEGSNVDITSELVGLMTSQRNYQANSKVIGAQSEMMQALMQSM